jgi:hypothetical protein
LHQDIRFWEKTSECLKAITKQVDSQTAVLDTLVTKLSRLKKDQAVSVKDLEQLIDELEGREKDAGRDRDARARSLTNIALCSFVVLGALFYWVSLRKLGVRPAGVWLLRCAQEWGLSPGGRALHCSETALTLFAVKRKLVEMLV